MTSHQVPEDSGGAPRKLAHVNPSYWLWRCGSLTQSARGRGAIDSRCSERRWWSRENHAGRIVKSRSCFAAILEPRIAGVARRAAAIVLAQGTVETNIRCAIVRCFAGLRARLSDTSRNQREALERARTVAVHCTLLVIVCPTRSWLESSGLYGWWWRLRLLLAGGARAQGANNDHGGKGGSRHRARTTTTGRGMELGSHAVLALTLALVGCAVEPPDHDPFDTNGCTEHKARTATPARSSRRGRLPGRRDRAECRTPMPRPWRS